MSSKAERDAHDPCKIYVGGCPKTSEAEITDLFQRYGAVEKVWVARSPPGFAFVWMADPRDASDAVAALDKYELGEDQVLAVQIARGPRHPKDDDGPRRDDRDPYRDDRGPPRDGRPRPAARPRGPGGFRVKILNVAPGTDWRDLKDEFRRCGEVTYADVRGSEGLVEFNSEEDRLKCIKEYDDTTFKGARIRVETTEGSSADYFANRGIDPNSRMERAPPPRPRRDDDYDRRPRYDDRRDDRYDRDRRDYDRDYDRRRDDYDRYDRRPPPRDDYYDRDRRRDHDDRYDRDRRRDEYDRPRDDYRDRSRRDEYRDDRRDDRDYRSPRDDRGPPPPRERSRSRERGGSEPRL